MFSWTKVEVGRQKGGLAMELSFCSVPHNKILVTVLNASVCLALSWVAYMSLKQGLPQAQVHKEASIAILLMIILRKVRPRRVKYIAIGKARTGDQPWSSSHSVLWILLFLFHSFMERPTQTRGQLCMLTQPGDSTINPHRTWPEAQNRESLDQKKKLLTFPVVLLYWFSKILDLVLGSDSMYIWFLPCWGFFTLN